MARNGQRSKDIIFKLLRIPALHTPLLLDDSTKCSFLKYTSHMLQNETSNAMMYPDKKHKNTAIQLASNRISFPKIVAPHRISYSSSLPAASILVGFLSQNELNMLQLLHSGFRYVVIGSPFNVHNSNLHSICIKRNTTNIKAIVVNDMT